MSNQLKTNNLLLPSQARDRMNANRQKILRFLNQEKYSTAAILQQIIGLKNKASVCKILRKMEEENLVKKYQFTGYIVLWGNTPNSIAATDNSNEKITDWSYFEPSKINLKSLDHQLDIQQIHAACMKKNIKFEPGRMLGSRSNADKIPDGIITIGNIKIAVEAERQIKSKRRYDAVIYNYLKAVKADQYNHILYISPDINMCQKVKKVIHSLDQITMKINGQHKKLKLDSDKHLGYFDFIILEDLPRYLDEIKH